LGTLLAHPGYLSLVVACVIGGLSFGGFLPLWGAMIGACFGRDSFGRVMGLMGPIMGPLNWVVFWFPGWVRDTTASYDLAIQAFLAAIGVAACVLIFLRVPEREPGT
jgi:MFS family permease